MTVALDLRMEGPFVRRPTETIAAFALAPTLSDQSRDRLLAAWKAAGGQVEADALIARFAGSLGTSPRDAARLLWLLRADRDALAHRQLHRRAARRLLNSKAYPGFAKHVKEQLARLQTLSAKSRVGYRGPET